MYLRTITTAASERETGYRIFSTPISTICLSTIRPSQSTCAAWRLELQKNQRYYTATVPPPRSRTISGTGNLHKISLQAPQPTKLPPKSPKQLQVIRTLATTSKHLIVNACAGSGKTTTILQVAAAMPDKTFFVLLYSRRLTAETKERVKALGLKNIIISNYHALGYHYYTPECNTDEGLKRTVRDDILVMTGKSLPRFDILVMDEQQDMSPVIYRFIKKFIQDSAAVRGRGWLEQLKFFLLGDHRQEIYGYSGSSFRFLTNGDQVFGPLIGGSWAEHWERLHFDVSYRFTPEIIKFINEQVLSQSPEDMMQANEGNGQNLRPLYVVCDTFNSECIYDQVIRLISKGLKYDDILILSPSVKMGNMGGSKPILAIANKLARKGLPVCISLGDYASSPNVARGKIQIASYHQAKGIERAAVIVMQFDSSYDTYYNRNPLDPKRVNNAMLVALTRPKLYLVLVHDIKNTFLPFINLETLANSCDLAHYPKKTQYRGPVNMKILESPAELKKLLEIPEKMENGKKSPIGQQPVTKLISGVSPRLTMECMGLLGRQLIKEGCEALRLKSEIQIKDGLMEAVGDITGTVVPAIYEWNTLKKCSAFRDTFELVEHKNTLGFLPHYHTKKLRDIAQRKDHELNIQDITYVAGIHAARRSGFFGKVLTIPSDAYNWLTPEEIRAICRNMSFISNHNVSYENKLECLVMTSINGKMTQVCVVGFSDICRTGSNPAIWEIKTGEIKPTDYLQLALYAAIDERRTKCSGSYYLINALRGEVIQLLPKSEGAFEKILQKLVDANFAPEFDPPMTNEEFLAKSRAGFGNSLKSSLPDWINREENQEEKQKQK